MCHNRCDEYEDGEYEQRGYDERDDEDNNQDDEDEIEFEFEQQLRSKSKANSFDVSADRALEQALKTASHLTSWAGVAVRRAIRQRNERNNNDNSDVMGASQEEAVHHKLSTHDSVETPITSTDHLTSSPTHQRTLETQSTYVPMDSNHSSAAAVDLSLSTKPDIMVDVKAMRDALGPGPSDEHLALLLQRAKGDIHAAINMYLDASNSANTTPSHHMVPPQHSPHLLSGLSVESRAHLSRTIDHENQQSPHVPSTLSEESKAHLSRTIDNENQELRDVRNRAARDADSVTPQMQEDVKELLRMFGLPFVESPMEAEAQCAALEAAGVVDGVVTDDCDAFLFGAKAVSVCCPCV
jgi:hypothetical protein